METLLTRYRNITVLLLVIFAQLVLLAYQVKNGSDVRLIRVWSVTAVTPLARVIEGARGGTQGFLQNYVFLRDSRAENERMRTELGRLKLENQFLKTELATADRAKALQAFEQRSLSKMIAARIIATATGASASAVFVDRGTSSGIEKGMAVVTPDGIVGKVLAAYPTASQVLLATDPSFAAGVVSQKNHVRGILKGLGHGNCRVDYVQNEEKVETGEWFYTSGDDRVFPKGMPVGQVTAARPGNPFQDISVDPAGLAGGLEEVLVIIEGVHQEIPEFKNASEPVYLAPLPPTGTADNQPASDQSASTGESSNTPAPATDADKLREHYQDVSDAQGHKFGDNPVGSKAVNFNLPVKPGEKPAAAKTQTPPATNAAVPKPEPQAKPPAATPARPKAPPAPKPDDQ